MEIKIKFIDAKCLEGFSNDVIVTAWACLPAEKSWELKRELRLGESFCRESLTNE